MPEEDVHSCSAGGRAERDAPIPLPPPVRRLRRKDEDLPRAPRWKWAGDEGRLAGDVRAPGSAPASAVPGANRPSNGSSPSWPPPATAAQSGCETSNKRRSPESRRQFPAGLRTGPLRSPWPKDRWPGAGAFRRNHAERDDHAINRSHQADHRPQGSDRGQIGGAVLHLHRGIFIGQFHGPLRGGQPAGNFCTPAVEHPGQQRARGRPGGDRPRYTSCVEERSSSPRTSCTRHGHSWSGTAWPSRTPGRTGRSTSRRSPRRPAPRPGHPDKERFMTVNVGRPCRGISPSIRARCVIFPARALRTTLTARDHQSTLPGPEPEPASRSAGQGRPHRS